MEFKKFIKIPRLSKECVITEKIDGTNGVIYIGEDEEFLIGSRSRWLDDHNDNFNFWHWAMENKEELMKLGSGFHYGEWWGQGIQRKYDMKEKIFSLFNVHRWEDWGIRPKCCSIVPILYEGMFDTAMIHQILGRLKGHGSYASQGFMKPEGIVIYHKQGNLMFKKTIENDEQPKNLIK